MTTHPRLRRTRLGSLVVPRRTSAADRARRAQPFILHPRARLSGHREAHAPKHIAVAPSSTRTKLSESSQSTSGRMATGSQRRSPSFQSCAESGLHDAPHDRPRDVLVEVLLRARRSTLVA
eukprot:7384956-Prymnesium_polylepis.1